MRHMFSAYIFPFSTCFVVSTKSRKKNENKKIWEVNRTVLFNALATRIFVFFFFCVDVVVDVAVVIVVVVFFLLSISPLVSFHHSLVVFYLITFHFSYSCCALCSFCLLCWTYRTRVRYGSFCIVPRGPLPDCNAFCYGIIVHHHICVWWNAAAKTLRKLNWDEQEAKEKSSRRSNETHNFALSMAFAVFAVRISSFLSLFFSFCVARSILRHLVTADSSSGLCVHCAVVQCKFV